MRATLRALRARRAGPPRRAADGVVAGGSALLGATHAFAVFSAQYGHRIAAAAFESARVPVSLSWQAASDHLPALAQATTAAAPSASPDHLEEITGLDREAEAAAARSRK